MRRLVFEDSHLDQWDWSTLTCFFFPGRKTLETIEDIVFPNVDTSVFCARVKEFNENGQQEPFSIATCSSTIIFRIKGPGSKRFLSLTVQGLEARGCHLPPAKFNPSEARSHIKYQRSRIRGWGSDSRHVAQILDPLESPIFETMNFLDHMVHSSTLRRGLGSRLLLPQLHLLGLFSIKSRLRPQWFSTLIL